MASGRRDLRPAAFFTVFSLFASVRRRVYPMKPVLPPIRLLLSSITLCLRTVTSATLSLLVAPAFFL